MSLLEEFHDWFFDYEENCVDELPSRLPIAKSAYLAGAAAQKQRDAEICRSNGTNETIGTFLENEEFARVCLICADAILNQDQPPKEEA